MDELNKTKTYLFEAVECITYSQLEESYVPYLDHKEAIQQAVQAYKQELIAWLEKLKNIAQVSVNEDDSETSFGQKIAYEYVINHLSQEDG